MQHITHAATHLCIPAHGEISVKTLSELRSQEAMLHRGDRKGASPGERVLAEKLWTLLDKVSNVGGTLMQ